MRCDGCKNWRRGSRTEYGDGTVVDNTLPPTAKCACAILMIATAPDFGCNQFAEGSADDQIEVTRFEGEAWRHFEMIPCPDCSGVGSKADTACYRCAGTRNVRRYGDGFVGDERTRRHPKETAPEPTIDPGTILAPLPRPDISTMQTTP